MYGWHFLRADKTLGYGDGRKMVKGRTLRVDGPLVMCERGLHASPRAIDALVYAPGPIACYVRLSGDVLGPTVEHADKMCATERTVIAYVDATPHLHAFVRDTLVYRQPHIVSLFRKAELGDQADIIEGADLTTATPDEMREMFRAAGYAARDAARYAARAVAQDAARDAARAVARAVAQDAARDAARAVAQARYAARDAARADLNGLLERRLSDAMGVQR